MKKSLIVFIFFSYYFSYAQQLEENIYTATEIFISSQNKVSLQTLSRQEALYKNKVTTRDEQLALVFLQCNKAYYLKNHNDFINAISTYEDAWNRFSKNNLSTLSDYDIIEYCLKPLGNLYTKTGDYTNAENIIKHYIFLAEKSNNLTHQIGGAINLSKLYQSIGRHKVVLKIINATLKYFGISPAQKLNLENIKTTSLIALKQYDAVGEIKNKNSTPFIHLFNQYKNTYQLELQKGNLKNAVIYFDKAKEVFSKLPDIAARNMAKLYVEEAQLLVLLNSTTDALRSLQKAIQVLLPNFEGDKLPDKELLYAENTFIDIFDLYADLQLNSNNAIESYELSFYVSALLQDNITSQEAKIINQTANRARSEKCIEILFDEYSKFHNNEFLVDAFQFAERSKVSVLKEVSQKNTLLQHYPNDSFLLKEQFLLQQQERITNQLVQKQLRESKASEINTLGTELNKISIQLKSIKKEILNVYPQAEQNSFSMETLKQKLLKDEATVIEYFYGKRAIYQFIATAESFSFQKIVLDSTISNAISQFVHFFDNASAINTHIHEYTNQAFYMYKLLGFSNALTSKNWVVIPDGLLNFIPFEALLMEKTEVTNFSKMPFVINEKIIAYNSSVLFYLKGKSNVHTNRNLLGVFPVFENTNQTLTYSITEANAIKKEMVSTILMNAEATKNNFIKNAPSYSILHLSTHASGGSFMVPASIEFYKETMLLNELYSLNLDAELVVLSACETGVGKLQKGEGAMSIARGFQYAGVQNVLFSLWKINDLATSKIMQSFYKNYSANQSAFISNHNSKIAYLQSEDISNIKKSPYYWSSFVYYGVLTPAMPNYDMYYYLLGFITLLITLFGLRKYLQKSKSKLD
ncbi:MAG: CHAT domain-containing protein [Cyclobacteriaceae bacterium]|nr:CHAT domain-containing protein [Cyclobacteriaceae bacterium]